MAVELIEAMSGPWKPEEYRDSYTERVQKLIEDKRRGSEIVTEAEPPEPTAMSDLIAALERSVAEARGGRKRGDGADDRSNGSRKQKADLSGASKAELTALARELDIPGRSSMNRNELERAVAAASGGAGRKAS